MSSPRYALKTRYSAIQPRWVDLAIVDTHHNDKIIDEASISLEHMQNWLKVDIKLRCDALNREHEAYEKEVLSLN